jgi:hypothetical protein
MPSAGSRIVLVRLPEPLLAKVEEAIASNNKSRFDEGWNLSTWIRDAIWSKLAHQGRARAQSEKRRNRHRVAKLNAARALAESVYGSAEGFELVELGRDLVEIRPHGDHEPSPCQSRRG